MNKKQPFKKPLIKAVEVTPAQTAQTKHSFREVEVIEPSETLDKKGWVNWGGDNLYPQFLWSLYYKSPIHGGIINSKVTYITAGGLQYSGSDEEWNMINKNGRSKHTLTELSESFALDQEVGGSFYILCKKDILSKKWVFDHLCFELIRPNENESMFFYSENWAVKKQDEKTGFKQYVSYFNRTSETTECVLHVKSKARQFILENKKLTSGYFPIPQYSGGIDSIMTDIEINFFRLAEVVNGYKGGSLISLNNGIPESEEAGNKIVKDLKLNASDKRKQGGIAVTFSDGKDREPSIIQLNGNDLDKRYTATETGLLQKIMISHSVINPKLFGVMQTSSVFDASLVGDFAIFKETYAQYRQKSIEDALNFANKNLNGMTGEISFADYSLSIEAQIDETNAVSQALNKMSPLVANKVLESLTVNEIRALGKLGSIEGGDVIASQQPATFKKEDDETQIIDLFKNCGTDVSNVKIIQSQEFQGMTDEEIINDFFTLKFQSLTDDQKMILNLIKNGESYDAIVKATGLNPAEVSKNYINLEKSGYIEGNEPTQKGLNEVATRETIEIAYTYEKKPNAPDLVAGGKSRPFCETLIELNRVYSRAEINTISGAVGRDVWSYRGGWYHNPETDRNTPSCRHYWKQNVILK